MWASGLCPQANFLEGNAFVGSRAMDSLQPDGPIPWRRTIGSRQGRVQRSASALPGFGNPPFLFPSGSVPESSGALRFLPLHSNN